MVNFHFVLGGEVSQVCKLMLEDGLVCREGQAWYLTKYARGVPISPRSLSGSFLPPALQQLLHLTDNSRDDHTLVIKLWL